MADGNKLWFFPCLGKKAMFIPSIEPVKMLSEGLPNSELIDNHFGFTILFNSYIPLPPIIPRKGFLSNIFSVRLIE